MKVTRNLHKGIRVKNTEGQNGLSLALFDTISVNSVQKGIGVKKNPSEGIDVRLDFSGAFR